MLVLQEADENRQMETRSSGRDSRPIIHPVMHLAFVCIQIWTDTFLCYSETDDAAWFGLFDVR